MCQQITASLGIGCSGAGEPSLVDLLAKVEKRQPVGLIRLSWTMDYPLMESYLAPLYGTNGSSNVYGYSNPAFDSLVTQGSEAPTPARGHQEVAAGGGHPGAGHAGHPAVASVKTCSGTPKG